MNKTLITAGMLAALTVQSFAFIPFNPNRNDNFDEIQRPTLRPRPQDNSSSTLLRYDEDYRRPMAPSSSKPMLEDYISSLRPTPQMVGTGTMPRPEDRPDWATSTWASGTRPIPESSPTSTIDRMYEDMKNRIPLASGTASMTPPWASSSMLRPEWATSTWASGTRPMRPDFSSSTWGTSTRPFDFIMGSSSTSSMNRPPVCISVKNNLANGRRGDEVKSLQNMLIENGYLNGEATGYFGNATKAAVMKFQKDSGLDQTGNVGPKTRSRLMVGCGLMPMPPISTSTASTTN